MGNALKRWPTGCWRSARGLLGRVTFAPGGFTTKHPPPGVGMIGPVQFRPLQRLVLQPTR